MYLLYFVVGNLHKRFLIYGDYCSLRTLTCHGQSGERHRGYSVVVSSTIVPAGIELTTTVVISIDCNGSHFRRPGPNVLLS